MSAITELREQVRQAELRDADMMAAAISDLAGCLVLDPDEAWDALLDNGHFSSLAAEELSGIRELYSI
jgi:hypothetical protein